LASKLINNVDFLSNVIFFSYSHCYQIYRKLPVIVKNVMKICRELAARPSYYKFLTVPVKYAPVRSSRGG